jgi:hypothetical protein
MKAASFNSAMPLPAQRSPCAPPLLAAYALGATLWAPVLAAVAGWGASLIAELAPSLAIASSARLLAAVWLLRFVFYGVGAWAGWSYGYGVNGVIVNRTLSLPQKAKRILRDWFGVLLLVLWLAFVLAAL